MQVWRLFDAYNFVAACLLASLVSQIPIFDHRILGSLIKDQGVEVEHKHCIDHLIDDGFVYLLGEDFI